MKFDCVIAGGRSAGATLAARLTEDPEARMCLLEVGGNDMVPELIGGNTNAPTIMIAEKSR